MKFWKTKKPQRESKDSYIAKIKTPRLKRWAESQEDPYIKTVLSILKFEERIAANPNDADAYVSVGLSLHWTWAYELALEMFRNAVSLNENTMHGRACRASLLATCPDSAYRDGRQALLDSTVALARAEEVGLPSSRSYIYRMYLEVHAAAQAELGRFDQAGETLQTAISVCKNRMAARKVQELIEFVARNEPIRKDSGLIRRGGSFG